MPELNPFTDFTYLPDNDTADAFSDFVKKAIHANPRIAAVCVTPDRIRDIITATGGKPTFQVATVANFPDGKQPLHTVLKTLEAADRAGAVEFDVVIPYHAYLENSRHKAQRFLQAIGKHTPGCLKCILETGALSPQQIQQAAEDAITVGADFMKTSTGKIKVGATAMAAKHLLQAIKVHAQASGKIVGFKASGGIRTPQVALEYLQLFTEIIGTDPTPKIFRIGASHLLSD